MKRLIVIIATLVVMSVPTCMVINTNKSDNEIQPDQSINYQEAYCVRVIDGDTIVVRIDTEEFKVRYIGIDTPETVDPNRLIGYFGKEASQKNTELVSSKNVRLEKDVSDVDKYDRLLRYVYKDNVMINAELVRLGYAKAATYPPDVKYASLFVKMEREARDNNRGLWAK
jgi:micrococcal nuclease